MGDAGRGVVWIDLDVHRVPDRVLRRWAPALLAAVLLAAPAATAGWGVLVTAILAAAAMAALFFVLAVVGSMGLGDVKLAGVTGLMLGRSNNVRCCDRSFAAHFKLHAGAVDTIHLDADLFDLQHDLNDIFTYTWDVAEFMQHIR